jgi:acetyl esterase/lipase
MSAGSSNRNSRTRRPQGKSAKTSSARKAGRARAPAKAGPTGADLLHPELREGTLAALPLFEALPPLADATVADFRAAMEAFTRPLREDIPVERRLIAGPDRTKLAIYVVNARAGTSRPAILHTHGGGFVGGAAKLDVRTQQDLAATLDAVCVTVEYRLAPETRWRGSVADNYAALRWLHAHATELGVDASRIAVMGESAGGGHAALLAIEARNRGEVPLALQLLIYPMLDDRTGSSRRHPTHHGMIWSQDWNRYGWSAFLGMAPGGRKVPAAAVPARNSDLSGLPATFIAVGALDLFVAEDIEYAGRLVAAGVPTELHVFPGAVHGFEEFSPDASLVKQFNSLKLNALRRAFGIEPV